MTVTSADCRARADADRLAAGSINLPKARLRFLASAERFEEMAAHAERTERLAIGRKK